MSGVMAFYDEVRDAVVVRKVSGAEVALLGCADAASFAEEVAAAARGESTGYEEFLDQEAGDASVAPGGACVLTEASMGSEDDCTTHEHEPR